MREAISGASDVSYERKRRDDPSGSWGWARLRVKSESVGIPPGLLAIPTNRDFGTLRVTYEVLVDDPNHLGLRPEISRTVDRYLRAGKSVQISLGSDERLQYSMVD